MGRYYSGDIEGKFWFAVQSSDAPERFGCEQITNHVHYSATDIQRVWDELMDIIESMGKKVKYLLDKYFNESHTYNEEIISEYLKEHNIDVSNLNIHKIISDYADYGLGKEIYKCLKKHGDCEFEAEI